MIGLGPKRSQAVCQILGVFTRPRDRDPLAEQRPLVEPAQVLAQRRDFAHDQDRGPLGPRRLRELGQLFQGAVHGLLAWQRAVVDHRRGIASGAAVRQQRVEDLRQLAGPGIADDRAFEFGQRTPVQLGRGLAFVLVPADQRHCVARARVGERHTAIRRNADGGGNPGNDLERDAVFVKKQRLFATSIEHEGVAPLQPCDHAAFAGLLDQQVADSLLGHRARCGRADVDPFGVRRRLRDQAFVDEVVVDDDIGQGQARQSAHGDQSRITGPCADQIDLAARHRRASYDNSRDAHGAGCRVQGMCTVPGARCRRDVPQRQTPCVHP